LRNAAKVKTRREGFGEKEMIMTTFTVRSLAWVLFIALTADGERLVESTPLSRHEAMSKEIPGDIASEDLDGSFKCRMKYRL
jgi:hypothetical protein